MRRVAELRGDLGRLGSAFVRDELRMLLGTFGHRPCGAGPVVCVAQELRSRPLGGAQVVSVVGRTREGIDRLRRSPGV